MKSQASAFKSFMLFIAYLIITAQSVEERAIVVNRTKKQYMYVVTYMYMTVDCT